MIQQLKNKFYLIYILFLITSFSYAQKIEIGTIKTISSSHLNEDREYWVYLPEHYNDERYKEQQYPIVYLLDGEKYFHVTSGIVNNLSKGYYPLMPECIVVAIKNTNRSRDLTPTRVSNLSYENGGAKIFQDFIAKELIPEINKNYRTLDYKILVGHSFGGLFTMNTLIETPNLFNAYIAIDPSLWWDNKFMVKKLDNVLKSMNFKKRTLFFANANSIGNQKNPNKQHYEHFEAKEMAIKKLKIIPIGLNKFIQYYEKEDHGSVVLPSLIDGFRFVFNDFRVNLKELMKAPSLLQENYQKLSKKLGYKFKPQCAYVDRVVDLSRKRGEKENAKILHQINMVLYPENIYLKNKFD